MHPSLQMAWAGLWTDAAIRAQFEAAWGRLIETCADRTGIVGIQPLAHPLGDAAQAAELSQTIRVAAEAKWGPIMLFVDGEHAPLDAPDVVFAPTVWPGDEPGADTRPIDRQQAAVFVRGATLAQLNQAEALGAGWAVWHDGFGTDAFALRDEDGRIGASGLALRDRIWPKVVGGSVQGLGMDEDGFRLTWRADGRNAGLTVLHVPGPGEPQVELLPEGIDGFTAYDPLSEELSVFVQGTVDMAEVRILR
jgi:hypothetical protein